MRKSNDYHRQRALQKQRDEATANDNLALARKHNEDGIAFAKRRINAAIAKLFGKPPPLSPLN